MAPVDPSLQVAQSHQLIANHSLIMGDIVVCEPRVSSHGMISVCRLNTLHSLGDCSPYTRNSQWTHFQINLNNSSGGDVGPRGYWFERELTQISVSHSLPHRNPPNVSEGLNIVTLQSVFFTDQDTYIIFHTLLMHIICWKLLAEKRRFLLSLLQSPQFAMNYITAVL